MACLKDLLPDPPVRYCVKPGSTVAEAARLMGERNVGIVMVMEGEKLVGVLSERDVIRRLLAKGKDPTTAKVDDIMTRDVVTATEAEDPEYCLRKMEQEGCRHMPVVSGDRVVAMVSIKDLMRNILRNKAEDLKMLEEYVTTP